MLEAPFIVKKKSLTEMNVVGCLVADKGILRVSDEDGSGKSEDDEVRSQCHDLIGHSCLACFVSTIIPSRDWNEL